MSLLYTGNMLDGLSTQELITSLIIVNTEPTETIHKNH